jgi:hypothetical protein
MFLLEPDIDHCIPHVTNPVHCATQSFPMTGLRGVFKYAVYGLGTQLCTVVLLVRATERAAVGLSKCRRYDRSTLSSEKYSITQS